MSVMYSPVLKYSDGVLRKSQEMDSIIGHHQQQQQQQQHCHNQQNSGLLRYRSAPNSFLASLVYDNTTGGCVNEEAFRSEDPHRYTPSTSSEMETMVSKLISSNNGWSNSEHVKQEAPVPEELPQQQNGYSYGSQLIYQQIQGMPNDSSGAAAANVYDGTSGVVNSITSGHSTQSKMGVGNCSNLMRQKSSPAGFFSNDCGLAALREVGSFRGTDVSKGQATESTSGLHGTISFSSRPSFCLKRMSLIAETENEMLAASCRNLANDNGSSKCYMPSFTSELWNGSAFNSQKSASEDEIMFSTSNPLEPQGSDFRSQNVGLTHHLSLPSSFTKMESIEKFLQIQGTVPCKIRAKRGFATHPRSIAERVRRTRISERIKKLQGLFPKSDKQTSTTEMLDLAVDYIKDLREQVKILTTVRARCRCTSNQKQHC